MMYLKAFIPCLIILLFSGCDTNEEPDNMGRNLVYDFGPGPEGWESIFADYPVGEESQLDLIFEHSPLPEPLDDNNMSLKISGRNTSDDLFMGIMKKVSGLEFNKVYSLTFTLTIASDAPESSIGVGGSPGSSVYLKAGAVSSKPGRIVDDTDWYRLDIDKGNQASEGEDMINMGTIGIAGEEFTYTLIRRSNMDRPVYAATDPDGALWLIIGSDSGFESTTTLYYDEINVTIK